MLNVRIPWLDDLPSHIPVVHLLPRFDNLLLGYAKRDWIVASQFDRRINRGGGIIHPTLLVNGRGLGTWQAVRRGKLLELTITPFEKLDEEILPLVEKEAERVSKFSGLERKPVVW